MLLSSHLSELLCFPNCHVPFRFITSVKRLHADGVGFTTKPNTRIYLFIHFTHTHTLSLSISNTHSSSHAPHTPTQTHTHTCDHTRLMRVMEIFSCDKSSFTIKFYYQPLKQDKTFENPNGEKV